MSATDGLILSLTDGQQGTAAVPEDHARRLIRDLQNRSPAAINYFARQLATWAELPKGAVLCTLPSRRLGSSASGVRQMALRLCELGEWLDGTHCLTRTSAFDERAGEHPEAALMRQLATLAVRDPELIQDRQVVLLTDISRSGKALRAGEILLLRAGAQAVEKRCLATRSRSD
jgi:hypothetical protein